jgi:hypothetical protein
VGKKSFENDPPLVVQKKSLEMTPPLVVEKKFT